jgi:hypothetical protein
MAGDFTRRTYDPRTDVACLFEQQGRVRVDADLNELVEVIDRRFRTTTMDVLHASAGRVVVPAETPDAFEITLTGGSLAIGPGRAYVDGIQADNHGIGIPPPALHFDRGLEEKVGTDPLVYSPQPYQPAPVGLPAQGTHLAYLDVWHRERTKDETPEVLDPALYGIDTASRRQIVWQVRLLTDIGNVDCGTPVENIPGWPAAAAARLTTAAVGVPAADDPCEIPAIGGYRGVTNRLYRVEIHDGGGFGQATYTWSRNGGSGGTSIVALNGADITVAQLGRDKYVRFATGDWVEILDDIHELDGQPGEMAKVASVDEARGIVTLTAPVTGPFPAPTTNGARLRKWDQRAGVPAGGVFTVSTGPALLEDGVQIEFTLDPEINGGDFRPHQYWLFAARAADSSVEILTAAPPVGPHHHLGKLAVIDAAAGTVVDCRRPWPPTGGGDSCACDQCVHADIHNQDGLGIQRAVDAVRGTGGIVCLEAGIYILRRPVRITRATSVTVRGKGWRTIVLTPGDLPAFIVEQSAGVTIEDLSVLGVRSADEQLDGLDVLGRAGLGALLRLTGGQIAVAVTNSVRVVVQRCVLVVRPTNRTGAPVVALLGIVADLTVRQNIIVGSVGIGSLMRGEITPNVANRDGAPTLNDHLETTGKGFPVAGTTPAAVNRQLAAARLSRLLLARSRLSDNIIGGLVGGILFGPYTVHAADNEVSANSVVAATLAGTLHLGVAVLGSTAVRANSVCTGTLGIATGLAGTRIADNDVFALPDRAAALADGAADMLTSALASSVASTAVLDIPRAGILLVDGSGLDRPLDDMQVRTNRVTNIPGIGILAASRVEAAAIEQNIVSDCALGGIVVAGGSGGAVAVNGNTVERIGRSDITPEGVSHADVVLYLTTFRAGIAVIGVVDADVHGNRVTTVESQVRRPVPGGIVLLSCGNGHVATNRVTDIGDSSGFAAGVLVGGTFDQADIVDCQIQIGPHQDVDDVRSWTGIVVSGSRLLNPAIAALLSAVRLINTDRLVAEVATNGSLLRLIPLGRELVSVRGNAVHGSGTGPLVRVMCRGHITLADNRVVAANETRDAAVIATGQTLITDANYVDVPRSVRAMELSARQATVLGNITEGQIILNTNNIQSTPPWSGLNVSI